MSRISSSYGLFLSLFEPFCCQDFAARGFRVPKIYYASYEADFDVRPVLLDLERRGVAYVAKASHMCCSKAVFLMQDGVDRALAGLWEGLAAVARPQRPAADGRAGPGAAGGGVPQAIQEGGGGHALRGLGHGGGGEAARRVGGGALWAILPPQPAATWRG